MSTRVLLPAAALIAGLGAAVSPGLAQTRTLGNTSTGNQVMQVNPNFLATMIRIDCVVRGTPVEFPDDIWLSNAGSVDIPAGYKVKWEMTQPAKTGLYTFAAAVPPNAGVLVANALPGGVPAGMPCTVTAAN